MDAQEETVRLLALQLRLGFDSQAEAIREFARAGFGPTRIAELLGTTPGTVNVTLAKARGGKKAANKNQRKGKDD